MLLELICVVVALCIWWWWRGHTSSLSHIPGPPGVPIMGNCQVFDGQSVHLAAIGTLKAKFPHVMRIDLFGQSMLLLNSAEAVLEAMSTRGVDFMDRPPTWRVASLTNQFHGILGQRSPERLKELRKIIHSSIKAYGSGMERLEGILQEAIDDLIEMFKQKKGQSFDPKELYYSFFTQILGVLTVGVKLPFDDPLYGHLKEYDETLAKLFTGNFSYYLLDIMPLVRYLPGFGPGKIARDSEMQRVMVTKRLQDIVASSKEDGGEPDPGTSYSHLKKGITESPDKTADLWQTLLDLLVAGTMTSASSMYIMTNILLNKPEVGERIAAEVEQVVGQRRVTMTDRQQMPYTMACVMELMRQPCVAPLSVIHGTTCDTQVQGYHVPKNTTVLSNLFAATHDEEVYPDPMEYRPERFLTETGELLTADHIRMKRMLTFGTGPRACIGETFTRHRLFLLIANLIRNFRFKPAEGVDLPSCDPQDLVPGDTLICSPFSMCALDRQ